MRMNEALGKAELEWPLSCWEGHAATEPGLTNWQVSEWEAAECK